MQLNQVQAQLKQVELQIATEVTNAAIQARNNAEAVQASQASRELAQTKLEAEQSKFEVGMSTNYFVVQAQRDLADAQNSELRAVLELPQGAGRDGTRAVHDAAKPEHHGAERGGGGRRWRTSAARPRHGPIIGAIRQPIRDTEHHETRNHRPY